MSEVNRSLQVTQNIPPSAQQLFPLSTEVVYPTLLAFAIFITPFINVCGILGNAATLIILVYNGLKESTNIVLAGLAACDLFISVTQFLAHVAMSFSAIAKNEMSLYFYIYVAYYVYGWSQYGVCVSVDLVSVVAIERMIAVCFPFLAPRLLTPSRIRCVVVTIYITVAIAYIPQFLIDSVYYKIIHVGNKTTIETQTQEAYKNFVGFYEVYVKSLLLVIPLIFPTSSTILCTIFILIKLTISSRNMKKLSSMAAHTKRIKDLKSVKLILVLCTFVIFMELIPTNIYVMYSLFGQEKFSQSFINLVGILVKFLYSLNACVNFIIYVTMSPKFAKKYKKIFTSLKKKM